MEKKAGKFIGKFIGKLIYWTPRILAILFILLLALFSLDIFEGNYGFWGTLVGLFMHNIPAMILLIVLIISWKHELVGGIVFNLFGIGYIIITLVRGVFSSGLSWYVGVSWSLIVAGPAFLVGILFLISWFRKKK